MTLCKNEHNDEKRIPAWMMLPALPDYTQEAWFERSVESR